MQRFRKWPIEKFAKIPEYIKKRYNLEIVLCGGLIDVEETNGFDKFYEEKYFNLVEKTSLIEIIEIIHNAKIVVSNETFVCCIRC